MTQDAHAEFAPLRSIIVDNEAWLTERILYYAKRQAYSRYTSTLQEAWRRSIAGISASLCQALERRPVQIELQPDDDFTADPLARFGIQQAERHRERGVHLGMFLGLMKYYGQSYLDLIDRKFADAPQRERFKLVIRRFFDRIEIGFCMTWQTPNNLEQLRQLQQANRAITNQKNKYLTLFESLQSPVALLDKDCRIDTVNTAWVAMFGGTGQGGTDQYKQAQVAQPVVWLADEIKRFASDQAADQRLEKAVQTPAGRRHLSIRIQRMQDVSEKFSGCVLIVDDITEQKKAEADLQETSIWLTEMFNALEEAVFIGTPGGRIVDANLAAQRIFGFSHAEMKDQTTAMLHVDEEYYQAFTNRVREAFVNEKQTTFEYVAKRKNGETFPIWVSINKLKKPDGSPLGIVSVLRDISALKQAEEASRNSERLHGVLELAGAVCHDLNQPLMAINGYAELLMMDCREDAPHYPKLKKIVEQVNKVGDITHKLMRVTRYETKTYLDQQIFDIEKSSDRE